MVLVDLGREGLPQWVAAPDTAPGEAVAVAARLAEVLRDSCYSRGHGGAGGGEAAAVAAAAEYDSAVQLRQGAWYLLAATLRGVATAAAAAAAAAAEAAVTATAAGAGEAAAVADGAAGWLAVVPTACRLLESLPELPLAEGCQGAFRFVCPSCAIMLRLRNYLPYHLSQRASFVASLTAALHTSNLSACRIHTVRAPLPRRLHLRLCPCQLRCGTSAFGASGH